jgi:cytidyltransferase-like protein
MKKKIVLVSGYFNPIHKGHIEYFHKAKKLGDKLFVIVNNDFQRELKGSKKFMLEDERILIINELKVVDTAFLSIDKNKNVSSSIEYLHSSFFRDYDFMFVNGGDQNNQTIPESIICKKLGIKLVDGLGEKIQSSSWLLNEN